MNPIQEQFDCQRRFDTLVSKVRQIRDDAASVADYTAQEPLCLIVIALVLPALTLGILATLSALLPPVLP